MSNRRRNNDNRNRGQINIGIFMAVLISILILVLAGFLGRRVFSEFFNPEETSAPKTEQAQTTTKTYPQTGSSGEVLNIYGQPLKEPKPQYVPEEETEAEDKNSKKKKDKAIYLEAIDNSNVHTEAGQDYPSVDVTEVGEQCKYLGVNEYGWLLIETEDGNEGYVYQTHFSNVEQVIKE